MTRPAKASERQEQVRRRQAELNEARVQRDKAAAENVKRQEKRLADAQERKANLEKRLAERKKPDAKPLPAEIEIDPPGAFQKLALSINSCTSVCGWRLSMKPSPQAP